MTTDRLSIPVLHLAAISVLLLSGCVTPAPSAPAATTSPSEDTSWAYFVDRTDGGKDIWTPGCHYRCQDEECTGELEFWGGDWCSGNTLNEWVNDSPHGAESDIARADCDESCRGKGSSGGRCVIVENACDNAYPSSRCECD